MAELTVEIPDILKEDKFKLKKQMEELVSFEAKRKALLEVTDEIMKGAKQLSDEEVVELARKFRKGRFKKLQERGVA